MRKYMVMVALSCLFLQPVKAVAADDVSAKVNDALKMYNSGHVGKAAIILQGVTDDVNKQLIEKINPFLPPAPAGWTLGKPEVESEDEMYSDGATINRIYQKGSDGELLLTVILNNPQAINALSFVDSAMSATTHSDGAKKYTLDFGEALVNFDAETTSGEAIVILSDRMAIRVNGSGIASDKMLVNLLKACDVKKMKEQME